MAQPIDHLRNLLRRETAARERVERPAAPRRGGESGVLFPDLLQRAPERPFLHLRIALRERRVHDLLRESPGGEFAFDAARAILRAADAHGRSRGTELVEPSFFREPLESARDSRR
jgi:hypothetical protein